MSHRIQTPAVEVGADKTIRHGVNRRRFLTWTGVAGALAFTPGLFADAAPLPATPSSGDHLFTLGVASGDPLPDGVVLWTRLASSPLARGGGMGAASVPVDWELATDEKMTSVIRRGRVLATAADGHSVHVDVRGLSPSR